MAFVNGDAVVDDEWKRVQEKTFTRWCNEQVKVNNSSIDNLSQDLSDGKKLIMLVEVLSQKKIGRYNKNCRLRAQKMENVQQALDFLIKEKVKLVNIRSYDIVDGNMKLISGLIWTLILHYQISVGFNDSGLTPKQALLKWLQAKLKDRPVGPPKNLTSDWTDGRRLATLCDEIAPGLFPDADSLDSADAKQNVGEAIELASEYLNVPKLMNPEDIANPSIDEKSMMTYLSEYIDAELAKPLEEIDGVKVYGPGVEPGVKTGEPTNFTIDSSDISTKRNPRVKITDSEGNSLPTQMAQTGDGKYTCSYAPDKVGDHKIHVTFGRPVKNSPFTVNAVPGDSGSGNDLSKIKAYGKGVESNQLEIHQPTTFVIDTKDLEGDLKLVIDGPNGVLDSEDISVEDEGEGIYNVEYNPHYPGNHTVDILFDNERVAQSPYSVQVLPLSKPDASKVKVTGKGVEKGRVDEPLQFCIDTRAAGYGNIDMSLEGPSKCETQYEDNGNGTCNVTYVPLKAGEYKISLKFDEKEISNSPFKVQAFDPTKVVATGPGIDGVGAKVNSPADVLLDTTEAGEGSFQCSVTGPDGTNDFEVKPTEETSILKGDYIPKATGEYTVSIKMEGEEIPNSPFILGIGDPDSLKLSGPALQYAFVNEPTNVSIDTARAGMGQLNANLKDPQGRNVATQIVPSKDEMKVEFTPEVGGTHKLDLSHGSFPLSCDIKVLDREKIKAYGVGLESKGNVVGKETQFIVETGGLDMEDLSTSIQCQQSELEPKITKLKKDTFQVSYTPQQPHFHDVVVKLAGVEVCKSPYKVGVCDPSKIRAYGGGLEKGVENCPSEFFIETSDAGEGALEILVEGPSTTEVVCDRQSENLLKVDYTPKMAGLYDVNISFGDVPITSSPFNLRVVRPSPDASKCIPHGMSQPGRFLIDAKDAGGSGMLEVGVCGSHTPCDYVKVNHNGDYTFNVDYAIPEPGQSEIAVKWHGDHIPGSPFSIMTEENN